MVTLSSASVWDMIVEHRDPCSPNYGQFLVWLGSPGMAFHYGLGLSDRYFFNTGPQDWRVIEMSAKRPWRVTGIPGYSPDKIMGRLRVALEIFADWPYDLGRWNCEHFGRLLVTGDPVCYQISYIPILSSWLGGGRNLKALSQWESALRRHSPDLL